MGFGTSGVVVVGVCVGGGSVLYEDVMPATGTIKWVLTWRMRDNTSMNAIENSGTVVSFSVITHKNIYCVLNKQRSKNEVPQSGTAHNTDVFCSLPSYL